MEHGRTVLAATVPVGRGRIAAFTDSTVWSSFAVFSFDREKLAMDLVRLLDREPSPYRGPVRWLLAAGLVAARHRAEDGEPGAGPAGGRPRPGRVWGGMAATEACTAGSTPGPRRRARVDEVTFLWQGGACAFPPVLGTPDSVPLDRSYDTLLVAVQRLGLVPRVAYTYDEDCSDPIRGRCS